MNFQEARGGCSSILSRLLGPQVRRSLARPPIMLQLRDREGTVEIFSFILRVYIFDVRLRYNFRWVLILSAQRSLQARL